MTSRTVYVTPEQYVEIERGQALKSTVTAPGVPAPGVHLGDGKGNVIEWIAYEPVPLSVMRIGTRSDALAYRSLEGVAKNERRERPPDEATSSALGSSERS